MNNKNSKIILCKDINLDREYVNVLDYTESNMITLCTNKALYSATNYTFIRPDINEIKVNASYQTCLQCNYMAFQNVNYGGKWFFAFIDEVSYLSDSSTKIKFTVDEHATWYDYWNAKSCLVLREHVADDTIGLHTFPENFETGEYICNAYQELGGFNQATSKVVVASTWLPTNTPGMSPGAQYYGGVLSGVYFMAFDYSNAKKFIEALDGLGKGSAIQSIFMAPGSLCTPLTSFSATLHSNINNDNGTVTPHDFAISGGFIGNTTGNIIILQSQTITMNTTLNGYIPHNNKLYCWPFNSLVISTATGQSAEYHYEDFINNTPVFNIQGTLTPGCDIKLYPENYKKIADTLAQGLRPGFSYGLIGSKFPICSWNNDAFTNWMTQQSVNHKFGVLSGVAKVAGMIFNSSEGTGNPASAYGGLIQQQFNYIDSVYQHAIIAPQQSGSLNGSNVAFGTDEMNFSLYKMSIKEEYARIIDNYFDKFGYKINRVKIPNMLSRTYWNYLQIGNLEEIGYSNTNGSVPAKSMDIINNIYRRGTTIWHSHDNIGNYSLSNTIRT